MTDNEFYNMTLKICYYYNGHCYECALRKIGNNCSRFWERTQAELNFVSETYYSLFVSEKPVTEVGISMTDIMNILSAE